MQEFSSPIKGLNQDLHDVNTDSNVYSFALNAVVEDSTGDNFNLANDTSNLLLISLNYGEQVLVHKYIQELNIILLFTVHNQIGRIRQIKDLNFIDKNANYELYCHLVETMPLEKQTQIPLMKTSILLESNNLNFNIHHRMDLEYKITDCDLHLYFNDKYNPDRFIYFDLKDNILTLSNQFKVQQGFDSTGNPIYTQDLDVNKINWYENITVPCASTEVISGGKLSSGTYQIMVSYATSKGQSLTSYLSANNPISVFTKEISEDESYETSKALSITVSNISTSSRYRYINLVLVEFITGFATYKLIKTLPITGDTLKYIYTGNNKAIELSENDIYQIYPFYKYSTHLAIANNYLFKAGLTEFSQINVQRIANKLQGLLRWFTVALKEGDYKDPEIAQNFRGYPRDETFAFGIQFYLGRGQWTSVGHIPGRGLKPGEDALITQSPLINDVVNQADGCEVNQKKVWQVYNTASITDTYPLKYDKCKPAIYQEGEFAYYESTEKYPTNSKVYGNLANTPILHAKFPDSSITHIHDGTGEKTYQDDNYIFPLGVKLAANINIQTILELSRNEGLITSEEFNSIQGYRLVRGNRVGNESIQARGLVFDVWNYKKDGRFYYYPNYPFNDLRNDPYLVNPIFINKTPVIIPPITDQKFSYSRKYTFHSPDTSFVQPSLGNTLKLETEEFGQAEGFFNKSQNQAEEKLLSASQYNLAIILGTILGEAVEFRDGATGQAQTVGQSAGALVGGIAGNLIAPGVGGSVGTSLGSVIGGLIGGSISNNNNLEDFWRANTILSQVEKIIQLFKLIAQYENYHWQYQAVGKYNNHKKISNTGNKQRTVLTSAYIDTGRKSLTLGNGQSIFFNNHGRESSVFLEVNLDLPKPTVTDTSRFTVSQTSIAEDYRENTPVYSSISAYYATVKNERMNQYGSVFDIEYLPLSCTTYKTNQSFTEFGGDTFINRFALKRKQHFFTISLYKLPNDTDILYSDYPNVATPKYFFDTVSKANPVFNLTGSGNPLVDMIINSLQTGVLPTDIIQSITSVNEKADWWLLAIPGIGIPLYIAESQKNKAIWKQYISLIGTFFKGTLLSPFNYFKVPAYKLDQYQDSYEPTSKRFSSRAIQGKMYLYSYGIPYFLCESSVNLDYRYAKDTNAKDFYPRQKDLEYWLQEKNVSPFEDNYYFYNKDYSKQNKEQIIPKYDINYTPDQTCKIEHSNRVIYSLPGVDVEDSDYRDPYLFNKALDFHDFDYKNGKLISINAIENSKILVRFENKTQIFSAYNTIQTDQATLIINVGDLFRSRPQEFINTDNGYLGSQHRDIISTEFGHVFVDAKRGQVFLLNPNGDSPTEISNKGMKNWFKQNLPFTISKYFDIDIDNAYAGIGISLVFDKRYNRFLLTKLDYEPILNNINYIENDFYYNNQIISLYDNRYFRNKSWTISYNFYTQSWVSFHSFIPNYYISGIDNYVSGLNSLSGKASTLWVHNTTNKSYQVYFSKLYPFTVEARSKPSFVTKKLTSVDYIADVIRFHNKYDKFFSRELGFDEMIAYNNHQNSGKMRLIKAVHNDLNQFMSYPKKRAESREVLASSKDNMYSVNDLENLVVSENNNIPIWIHSSNNVNKHLNVASLDYINYQVNNNYIEGNNIFVRLSNTTESNKKIIFKGILFNGIEYMK